QDLFDETERNALIADMSFGVALTFGVTGLVLLLTDSSGGEEEKAAEEKKAFNFAPYAGPNGGGAVGTFRF
ncbi:MAG: PEGA domain-containing protein, partial [Polyangiaceae bacterium]|nr:PEGA domain-containing protein [Polyangiaceae bacterium]